MLGTITSGPGFLPNSGGRHAVRERAMQDDDESNRGEQEQRRHQHQPDDQEIKAAPWRIFGARD